MAGEAVGFHDAELNHFWPIAGYPTSVEIWWDDRENALGSVRVRLPSNKFFFRVRRISLLRLQYKYFSFFSIMPRLLMLVLLLTFTREGSLVMMATVFLVGGLICPPVWLLVRTSSVVQARASLFLTKHRRHFYLRRNQKKSTPVHPFGFTFAHVIQAIDIIHKFWNDFFSSAINHRIHESGKLFLRLREFSFVFCLRFKARRANVFCRFCVAACISPQLWYLHRLLKGLLFLLPSSMCIYSLLLPVLAHTWWIVDALKCIVIGPIAKDTE